MCNNLNIKYVLLTFLHSSNASCIKKSFFTHSLFLDFPSSNAARLIYFVIALVGLFDICVVHPAYGLWSDLTPSSRHLVVISAVYWSSTFLTLSVLPSSFEKTNRLIYCNAVFENLLKIYYLKYHFSVVNLFFTLLVMLSQPISFRQLFPFFLLFFTVNLLTSCQLNEITICNMETLTAAVFCGQILLRYEI